MAEYVMHPDDDATEVARQLLARVDDPQAVMWSHRPDVPGGGVFVVRDEETVAEVVRLRQQARDEQAKRIADAQQAADERDAKADETGLTPTELGIPASTGTDPGAPGTEGVLVDDESGEDGADDDEPAVDDPSTPDVDESKLTPAQRRAAKRKAAADQAAADEAAQSNGATPEETK